MSFKPFLAVIGIDFIGPEFKNKITTLLFDRTVASHPGYTLQQIQQILIEIYQESMMQVFDCMTPDFQDFSLRLSSGLNFSRFINGQCFQNDPVLQQVFRECFLEFGTGIFLAMRDQGHMSNDRVYILDNPALDHFTCSIYPK